jgi:hypothetical protein
MGLRSEPASKPVEGRVKHRYPEELTPEELAQMKRVMPVDGEAYIRWLRGEGPDPCPPESSG